MRVAVVTTSYPQFEGDPAGHFVESEARAMARNGCDVTVVAPTASAPRSGRFATDRHGVRVAFFDGGEAFGWPGAEARLTRAPWRGASAVRWALSARRFIQKEPFERVIAHWAIPSAFLCLSRAHRFTLEVVSHGGDVRLLEAMPRSARVALVSAIAKRADSWRFVSLDLKTRLVRSIGHDAKQSSSLLARVEAIARVAPPQLELPDVAERAKALRNAYRGDAPLLVTVGRLVKSKRVDRAIRYAAAKAARLVVVGDGPERDALEELSRALRVRPTFVGTVLRNEAVAWIGAADTLLIASESEGLSTVEREANALKTAVIWLR